jgi:hypothetical protein
MAQEYDPTEGLAIAGRTGFCIDFDMWSFWSRWCQSRRALGGKDKYQEFEAKRREAGLNEEPAGFSVREEDTSVCKPHFFTLSALSFAVKIARQLQPIFPCVFVLLVDNDGVVAIKKNRMRVPSFQTGEYIQPK